tara:strand:+ start:1364 stop:1939 length:576 start_codon:yes stop_codon:yes gene_type:complete
MAKVNLLPWREERRKELLNEFLIMLGFVALVAVITIGAVHFYHSQLIEMQKARISFIDKHIDEVDKKIVEIKELEKKKESLLSRMRAIESLQRDRPLIVRLFDELVRSMPDGMSVTKLTQLSAGTISIEGEAQSNARVSSFMRKIEQSAWLQGAKLKVIKEKTVNKNKTVNSFVLTFAQVRPSNSDSEDES